MDKYFDATFGQNIATNRQYSYEVRGYVYMINIRYNHEIGGNIQRLMGVTGQNKELLVMCCGFVNN